MSIPQMSPLMWFSLYFYFLVLMLLFIIILYYFLLYNLDFKFSSSLKLVYYKIKW